MKSELQQQLVQSERGEKLTQTQLFWTTLMIDIALKSDPFFRTYNTLQILLGICIGGETHYRRKITFCPVCCDFSGPLWINMLYLFHFPIQRIVFHILNKKDSCLTEKSLLFLFEAEKM